MYFLNILPILLLVSLFYLLYHHNINFLFGVLFLFFEELTLLLFCLLNKCFKSCTLIYSMSVRAVVLEKYFTFCVLVCVFILRIFKNHSFCEGALGEIEFSKFSILVSKNLTWNGWDHLSSCSPVLLISFFTYLALHGKEFP